MPDYHLSLYDTSGRQITRGNRISAVDDLEAVAKTEAHRPSAVYIVPSCVKATAW